jgi:hypothetical protein
MDFCSCYTFVLDLEEVNVANPICDVIRASESDNNLVVFLVVADIAENTTIVIFYFSDFRNSLDSSATFATLPVFEVILPTESRN